MVLDEGRWKYRGGSRAGCLMNVDGVLGWSKEDLAQSIYYIYIYIYV